MQIVANMILHQDRGVLTCSMLLALFACATAVPVPLEDSYQRTYGGSYYGAYFEGRNVRLQLQEEMFVSEVLECSSASEGKEDPTCIPCNYTGRANQGRHHAF